MAAMLSSGQADEIVKGVAALAAHLDPLPRRPVSLAEAVSGAGFPSAAALMMA
jgi:hypothetical protein